MLSKERGGVLILEPESKIYDMVYEYTKDKYDIIHTNTVDELRNVINESEDDINLFIIWDELPMYDALDIIKDYKDYDWFKQGLCIVVSKEYNEDREEKANLMGVLEYIVYDTRTNRSKKELSNRILHEIILAQKIVNLHNSASKDGLTEFYNHEAAPRMVSKLLRKYPNQEFMFAMIDLDFFKQINDFHGHEFGDCILKAESLRLKNLVTSNQAVAIRFGGDEFIVMMPILTDIDESAQQLFNAIHWIEDDCQITNSIGIATTITCERDWDSLFRGADQSLFIAKGNGRNQYHIYTKKDQADYEGDSQDMRNERLNIGQDSLIHALVNGYDRVFQMDLLKLAVVRLGKLADGTYGWGEPIDYLAFINRIVEMCEPEWRFRFSEFVNPNTVAGRLKNQSFISFNFKGVDGELYLAKYVAGDVHPRGKIINALLLIRKAEENEDANLTVSNDVSDIERCIAKCYSNNYNAIWLIHPKTLERELISVQTDIIRHRRLNALFEGGNYWEETLAYIQLYVAEKDKERLITSLHPNVIFGKIPLHGPYIEYFERTTDGTTYECEYCYVWSKYRDEDVVLQMYRRLNKITK